MKTDRELLELAARAAGVDWFDEPAAKQGRGLHMKSGPFWNPLTDDGDALRLAVKLRIAIDFNRQACIDRLACPKWYAAANHHPDWNAATRRAITRAAAAIGESMP